MGEGDPHFTDHFALMCSVQTNSSCAGILHAWTSRKSYNSIPFIHALRSTCQTIMIDKKSEYKATKFKRGELRANQL